eukprot:Cvel_34732.t1-p1 / transcript=Cvel_34732.t1 / gene=Cvel_34732 / organism=Chromera_velia_CCMP2878 / gene_product=Sushi, von Willebrand factor type A, EGF and, putative / transcript_product=Sushi, von Willebrand factor type A, EGF and, putative / location=Cvel_scaffold6061:98-3296(+) / protein_length=444 / sequence_SO=supercontig / SO=protein_coding / is_pseudo=false
MADNGTGIVSYPSLPMRPQKGDTQVEVVGTDSSGNRAVCTFTLRVIDAEAPVILCPADYVQKQVGGVEVQLLFRGEPLVLDNVDPPSDLVIKCDPPKGAIRGPGSHAVSVNATDRSGNVATCSFIVIVEACPSGGFRDCEDCPCICSDGFWQDLRGLENVPRNADFPAVCRACVQESTSARGSFHPSQCVCKEGFYFVPDLSKGADESEFFFWESGRCLPCPDNASCDGGMRSPPSRRLLSQQTEKGLNEDSATRRVLLPPPGPKSSTSSLLPLVMHARPVPDRDYSQIQAFPNSIILQCPTGGTCMPSENKAVYQLNGGKHTECKEGFTGPLCSECEHYRWGEQCELCEDPIRDSFRAVGLFLVVQIAIAAYTHLNIVPDDDQERTYLVLLRSLFNFVSLLAVLSGFELSNVVLPWWADLSALVPIDWIPSVADIVRLDCAVA